MTYNAHVHLQFCIIYEIVYKAIINLAHAGARLQYSLCVCVFVCYCSSGHIVCSTAPSETPTESARCKEQNKCGNFANHS